MVAYFVSCKRYRMLTIIHSIKTKATEQKHFMRILLKKNYPPIDPLYYTV